MKIKRIDRLWARNDPVIREMLSMDGAESLLAKQREPSCYGGMQVTSGESLRVALAADLHSRGNLFPSAVRAARGHTGISVLCGTCQQPG